MRKGSSFTLRFERPRPLRAFTLKTWTPECAMATRPVLYNSLNLKGNSAYRTIDAGRSANVRPRLGRIKQGLEHSRRLRLPRDFCPEWRARDAHERPAPDRRHRRTSACACVPEKA